MIGIPVDREPLSAPVRQPIRIALETGFVIYFVSFVSAVIATGAPYPPTLSSLYAPLLMAILLGGTAYAAARQIALPPLPPLMPPRTP
jgi:hypothetical protein